MTYEERFEYLTQSIESHDRQIGELTGQIVELKDSIATLARATNDDATAIRTLARIAEAHEHRITRMEGGTET
jgi:hypothetical protein